MSSRRFKKKNIKKEIMTSFSLTERNYTYDLEEQLVTLMICKVMLRMCNLKENRSQRLLRRKLKNFEFSRVK